MAGIGFDLRRLVAADAGFVSKIRAYASAGLISSGPWIITMLGLSIAGLTRTGVDADQSTESFLALMTYAFAFSLLTVSTLQMVFTRWLADALYNRSYDRVLPAFVSAMTAVGVAQALVGATFATCVGLEIRLACVTTMLYVVVSLTWVAMIWLSVIRQYERILISFVLGVGVFWLSLQAFDNNDVVSALASYTAGAALTLALMIGLILRGTERGGDPNSHVLKSVIDYPMLLVVGTTYGIAVWVDKFLFWYAEGIESVSGVRSHPLYDSSFFLAYLTVVPAMTINLVHLETSFYERYRAYYAAILGGFPLAQIEHRRREMVTELRFGAKRLVRMQGAVTAFCVVFAGWIVEALGMPEGAVRVFRFACIGAFFQVLFLITMLVQLYFDLRREAAISCVVFLIANMLLATWSLRAGVHTYGAGHCIASFLALIVAFVLLDRAVRSLNYLTFTRHARPSRPRASAPEADQPA